MTIPTEKVGLCQSQRCREKGKEREKKRSQAGWQEDKKGEKEGRKRRKKSQHASCLLPLSKTRQAGHSIKAIALALLAILEIGSLETVHSEAVGCKQI